ncbi:hypothetical protein QBC32DRAFT_314949 [Pseudoneurospora amorphoporcata]|uniref:Uncharacterized protein n=1 Tax=Pseudoneurospora amorphoporcata TaxID=241081 RepID=A0AAN6NT66_9PEZI|nr:hypothetical protein QBC32DRAFT_314949 [Pseudoneurospora amorphoporcata]
MSENSSDSASTPDIQTPASSPGPAREASNSLPHWGHPGFDGNFSPPTIEEIQADLQERSPGCRSGAPSPSESLGKWVQEQSEAGVLRSPAQSDTSEGRTAGLARNDLYGPRQRPLSFMFDPPSPSPAPCPQPRPQNQQATPTRGTLGPDDAMPSIEGDEGAVPEVQMSGSMEGVMMRPDSEPPHQHEGPSEQDQVQATEEQKTTEEQVKTDEEQQATEEQVKTTTGEVPMSTSMELVLATPQPPAVPHQAPSSASPEQENTLPQQNALVPQQNALVIRTARQRHGSRQAPYGGGPRDRRRPRSVEERAASSSQHASSPRSRSCSASPDM